MRFFKLYSHIFSHILYRALAFHRMQHAMLHVQPAASGGGVGEPGRAEWELLGEAKHTRRRHAGFLPVLLQREVETVAGPRTQ